MHAHLQLQQGALYETGLRVIFLLAELGLESHPLFSQQTQNLLLRCQQQLRVCAQMHICNKWRKESNKTHSNEQHKSHKEQNVSPPKWMGSSTFTHWQLGRATSDPFSLRIRRIVMTLPVTYWCVSIATTLKNDKTVFSDNSEQLMSWQNYGISIYHGLIRIKWQISSFLHYDVSINLKTKQVL